MKALKLFTLLGLVSLLATSCSSSMRMASSSAGDDIYFDPSQDASGQLAAASNGKRVPMDKSYRDLLNETNRAISDTLYEESDSTGNPYADVLADDYEKAKRNRELGLRDPWNGMSTNAAYSQNMWYATAYDPAFYNVIVMGNTIWAEPKYISSMFGYPYNSPYINFGSYYSPWRNSWNYSFNFGFGWGWSSNWGWGYNNWYDPYWGGYYGWNSPWYDTPHHHYHSNYFRRDVVYGPMNGYDNKRYEDRTSYSTRSYNRERSNNTYNYSRENSREITYRREMNRDENRNTPSSSNTYYTSRRPSNVSQTRPVSTDYTPTYSRPSRTNQPAFNEGQRGSGQTYERRSSAVVGPRSERNYDYNTPRNNNTYTPSRSTDYGSSRNTNEYNSSRSNSTYTPSSSSSSSSSRDNSGATRSGGRR
ncbi:hypothetical protein [Alistipes sp. ZOR0009]|uniref:hypothetical protein n=1 Tax=Alistipes sp. ZOR0009 TaxID=1339253 RepID=UPI0012E047BC|nr:hypothetical protein [Alistipes sp. ZOR0009]